MQLTGFITILLFTAAATSVGVSAGGPGASDPLSYTTGIAICVIVSISAGIAAWTEHEAGEALEALSKMTLASIYVVRDGEEVQVPVPGVVGCNLTGRSTGVPFIEMRGTEKDLEAVIIAAEGAVNTLCPTKSCT